MRWNKKAALELSITAIVVLIIAITVLGLAIFFIKNLFKGGTEIFTGELAKIKEQLRKNIEETGELIVMSKGTELEVKRGERLEFHVGIRNTVGQDLCYRLAAVCKQPFTTGKECIANRNNRVVGGQDDQGNVPGDGEEWFPRMLAQFEIPSNDIAVEPVTLQVANADPDTYQMELQVFQGDAPCGYVGNWKKQSKRFHVVLS